MLTYEDTSTDLAPLRSVYNARHLSLRKMRVQVTPEPEGGGWIIPLLLLVGGIGLLIARGCL